MSVTKFKQRDHQSEDIHSLRRDCLALANRLDKFSEDKECTWPRWVKEHADRLRELAVDIAEKDHI